MTSPSRLDITTTAANASAVALVFCQGWPAFYSIMAVLTCLAVNDRMTNGNLKHEFAASFAVYFVISAVLTVLTVFYGHIQPYWAFAFYLVIWVHKINVLLSRFGQ